MFLVDRLILLGGTLLILGIVSSKFSTRVGLPVLVLFLAVGMLAGEEGLGGIEFDDVAAAHAIGTVALGIILFDGGLQTRTAWRPAALLATVGVLLTAAVTGLAASYMLALPPLTGMLLGSIVASTDAAAVFAVLRSQGVHLRRRLAATLEIESGSNDPMAIFLTVGLIEVLAGRVTIGTDLAALFAAQMGIGAGVRLAAGWVTVQIINRINLSSAGLYPVLAGACGFIAFGLAAVLGGSGFLAIYLFIIAAGEARRALADTLSGIRPPE
jgi:potassium/hydrogen antiporter